MSKRIKNFSKDDSMKSFRIITTIILGTLCGVFTYYDVITILSISDLPILMYVVFLFPTGVTLSCMLVGIFVEEDAPTKPEYLQ